MISLGLKGIGLLLLLAFPVMCSNFQGCEGRRGKHWRAKQAPSSSLARKKAKGHNGGDRRHGRGGGSGGRPRLTPETMAAMFDVLDFGAKGDGVTDDTKAFEGAWAAACKVEASTVIVPAEFEFLLDGTIIAPTSAGAWGAGSLQWLEFTKLQDITIRGSGVIDGRGSVWWTNSDSDIDPINAELGSEMPQIRPTVSALLASAFLKQTEGLLVTVFSSSLFQALRFYGSYNATVTGIRIQNSPRCHLKFDNCEAVEVFNITVSSPGDSPNTDGIHLQNSRNVWIHRVDMGCGDDCVSIQTGCSNIYIHDVDCGPGHGISIGGLGRDNTKACVSNITVRDINLRNTMTGVRIKTWQGGSGSVQAIQFSNIKVWEVQIPMVIDQFYCDRSSCENQSSAVALSSIAYESIRGTFTVKPVHFACSDSSPCSGISLSEVELEPLRERHRMNDPFCWQAFGELYAPTIPPITCLQIGKPASNGISTDHDLC
ncbi:Glycosyl hydrolases family 28 [Musa troglodytarum]|uniref:Glycosyl hydrolases family 28 n=1 Tax=Musa troglodytarum TaxID=320322 RepID=A0A9E7FPM3_9LILI|nr:Glycosyl hydrolases family 28 [Musa troglodytarum]